MPSLISFADYFSLDDYTRFSIAVAAYRHNEKLPQNSHERATYQLAKEQEFAFSQRAFVKFLRARAAEGSLGPIAFSRGLQMPFADAWNRMVDGKEPPQYGDDELLSGNIAMTILIERSSLLEEAWGNIVARVDLGDMKAPEFGRESLLTGESYRFITESWPPIIWQYVESVRGAQWARFQPLLEEPEIAPASVQHVEIPIPTGELLVADWFRIDAFTDIVESEDGRSLNASMVQNDQALEAARKFGFLSFSVGNSSPGLYARNGCLLVANMDPDRHTEGRVGQVCTDMWAVTAIDRQVLEELVARTHPEPGEAKRIVATYLSEESFDTVQTVHLPKGTLHAYFDAREGLHSYSSDKVDVDGVEQLYIVFSKEPLTWNSRSIGD